MGGSTAQTAIVTGASSGIGAATARMLAEEGARVVGGARRVERLETEVALELDVTDPESCERFVDAAGPRTCSSTRPGSRSAASPFTESTEEDERTVFETNVNGLVRMTRLVLQRSLREPGHIVNIGSVAGRWAYPNGATYVTAKFAVRGFTRALREDLLGRDIRVTTVDSGPRRDGVLGRALPRRRGQGEVGLRGDEAALAPTTSPTASSSPSRGRRTSWSTRSC